jgi:hypothetical protein
MTDHLAAVTVTGAAIAGSSISQMLADATGVALPDWMSVFLGPLGSVACLLIALRWLANRADKSEQRAIALQQEHAVKLEALTLAAMKVTDKVANSLDSLVQELRERPCGMKLPNHRINHETDK